MRPVPLTSLPGLETAPSLSPDGQWVAFAWRPAETDSAAIYRQRTNGRDRTRVTSGNAAESMPAWSPNGASIAYLRWRPDGYDVVVAPAWQTGAGRVIAAIPRAAALPADVQTVAWTPDGRQIIVPDAAAPAQELALAAIDVASGARRVLTRPEPSKPGDVQAAVSPDGSRVAFVRYASSTEADVYVGDRAGTEKPRRLTADRTFIRGLAWTPDGRALIFSSTRAGGGYGLWRLDWPGGGLQQIFKPGPAHAVHPAVSRTGQVACQLENRDVNIWAARAGAAPAAFAPSAWPEYAPSFSPDGARIAFVSARSGHREIWTAAVDGGAPEQATRMRGPYMDTPRWSPDGKRIAFMASDRGNRDVYVVQGGGGVPLRLTSEPSEESRPSWSCDSRRLFVRSDRSGAREIWKISADRPEPGVQITRGGAYEALVAPDCRTLYFTRARTEPGLWRTTADGGAEEHVLDGVREGLWTVTPRAILFLERHPGGVQVGRWPYGARKTSVAAAYPLVLERLWPGFASSTSGTIAWTQEDSHTSDLVLLR